MRFVTTRGVRPLAAVGAGAPQYPAADAVDSTAGGVSLRQAMLDGLAPDGGLYVPEAIEGWQPGELARLGNRTLTEIGYRVLRPYTRGELDATICEALVVAALNFPRRNSGTRIHSSM